MNRTIMLGSWATDETEQAATRNIAQHPESTLDLLIYLGQITTLPNPLRTLLQFLWFMFAPSQNQLPNWDNYIASPLFRRVLESCHLDLDELPDFVETNPFRHSNDPILWIGEDLHVYHEWRLQPPSGLDVIHRRWAFRDISDCTVEEFLQACEVDKVNASLAKQHVDGRSALHFAAKALGDTYLRLMSKVTNERLRGKRHAEWFALCQTLIENGADYHLGSEKDSSPLDWYFHDRLLELDLRETLTMIGTWTELLIAAGVSFHSFWTTEVVIHSRGRTRQRIYVDPDKASAQTRAGRSASTEPYTVCCSVQIPVYCLKPQDVPGSWTDPARSLPKTICWDPQIHELGEGIWSDISDSFASIEFESVGAAALLQKLDDRTHDIYRVALEGTQDDSLPMALLLSKRSERGRRRSASQPPPHARGGATYVGVRSANGHAWCPTVHLCPHESRRTLCGWQDFDSTLEMWTVDIRSCFSKAENGWSSPFDMERLYGGLGLRCGQCDFSRIGNASWRCDDHEKWAFT